MLKRIVCCALALSLLLMSGAALAEGGWLNILLLGCDLSNGMQYGRSDTMMILSLNTELKQVKLTSIMRDTWVHLPGYGEGKINAATVYGGPEFTVENVNENFGTDIEKYVLVDIDGLVSVIDLIGGIDVEISDEEVEYINAHTGRAIQDIQTDVAAEPLTKSGRVHLCGVQAVQHARNRTIGSDYERTARQRDIILAIAQKIKGECSAAEILQMLEELMKHVETNFNFAELAALATVVFNFDLSAIEQYRIPADGTYRSGTYNGVWSIRPNFGKNTKLLHDFIYESAAEE